MKLTEEVLKRLILETMEEDQETKKLVSKAFDQALDNPDQDIVDTLAFTVESFGIDMKEISNYLNPQIIVDKILKAVDSQRPAKERERLLKTIFNVMKAFSYPLEKLAGHIELEQIKKMLRFRYEKGMNLAGYVGLIDLLVKLGNTSGEDLTDFGGTISEDLAAYMNNLVSSGYRSEWAPLLVSVKGSYNQKYAFSNWLKNTKLLNDEQLIKLFNSGTPATKEYMKTSKKLASRPKVGEVIDAHFGKLKKGSSRLRRLRRKK